MPGGGFDTVPSASSGQALRRLRPGPFGKLRAGSPKTPARPLRQAQGRPLRQAQDRLTTNGGASGSIGVLGPGWGRRDDGERRKARSLGGPLDDRGWARRCDRKTPHRLPPKTPESFDWLRTGSASPPGEGKIAGMTGGVPVRVGCRGWFDTVPSASSGQALRQAQGRLSEDSGPAPSASSGQALRQAQDRLTTNGGAPGSIGVLGLGWGRRDDGERRKARSLGGPRDDRWGDEALRPEDPSPTSAEDAGILRLAQDRFCLSPRRGEDRRDGGGECL